MFGTNRKTVSISLLSATVMCLTMSTINAKMVLAETNIAQSIEQAKMRLDQGKPAEAIKILEPAITNAPGNADALLALGKAYKQTKNYEKAKTYFRAALKAGRGTPITAQANQELLSLPIKTVSPHGKKIVSKVRGKKVAAAGIGHIKMLTFTATWAEPCKQLNEDIAASKSTWGNQVEIVSVDVDDPKSEKLMDQYDISPVPTVIFLDDNDQLVSYIIGYSGIDALKAKVKTLTTGGGG